MENTHAALIWIALLAVVMFATSIALVWVLIFSMPTDYLTRDHPTGASAARRHPLLRIVTTVAKNVFGLLLVIMGVVMLVTPGQGLLSIVIGLTLLNFPGKRTFIRRMLGRRRVLNMINRLRRKAGRPPVETAVD